MKRTVVAIMTMAAVVAASTCAFAASGLITGSRHDLSAAAEGGSKTTQICVFCHTPHNAAQPVPLWNRTNMPVAANFKLYTSSATLQMKSHINGFSADSISLFCMSCHDGGALAGTRIHNEPAGVAHGALIPDDRYASALFTGTGTAAATINSSSKANFGTNLQNSHPVNIPYDPSLDPAFNAKNGTKVGNNITLYYSSVGAAQAKVLAVECSSCHAVHGSASSVATVAMPKFIRSTMAGSKLCLACHIK